MSNPFFKDGALNRGPHAPPKVTAFKKNAQHPKCPDYAAKEASAPRGWNGARKVKHYG